jgi:hypothetical protein
LAGKRVPHTDRRAPQVSASNLSSSRGQAGLHIGTEPNPVYHGICCRDRLPCSYKSSGTFPACPFPHLWSQRALFAVVVAVWISSWVEEEPPPWFLPYAAALSQSSGRRASRWGFEPPVLSIIVLSFSVLLNCSPNFAGTQSSASTCCRPLPSSLRSQKSPRWVRTKVLYALVLFPSKTMVPSAFSMSDGELPAMEPPWGSCALPAGTCFSPDWVSVVRFKINDPD